MTNIKERYEKIYTKSDKSILEIYNTRESIKEILENINEVSFTKLLKIIDKKDNIAKQLISDEFILDYLQFLFYFANKWYFKKNKCSIRCQHWVFEFNTDNTIRAINDFRNNQYITPKEVLNQRVSTSEYRFLHNGYQYYTGRISFKTFLKRRYPDINLVKAYVKFSKDKKKYSKNYYISKMREYDEETDRLIVQAKVSLRELEFQKNDYKKFTQKISNILPTYEFIICNQDFAKKII